MNNSLQNKYSSYLLKILPISNYKITNNHIILNTSVKQLKNILYFLKNHSNSQYKVLTDIIGIDFLTKKKRFKVIYNLLSITYNNRIFIEIEISEKKKVFSITRIYKNSNWFEREIWDMFGIFFKNHPDLRRILTDYGFEGFPLRKDFPVIGFLEVQYSESRKNIIYNSISLARKYYNFSFENSWII